MQFTKVVLYTGEDGRAHFREETVDLSPVKPTVFLSPLAPSGGFQLRMSPAGFRSEFHCSEHPQWLFVLSGRMEIGLQDGTKRVFGPGDHFFSTDTLPHGATFDPKVHGHCSQALDGKPLTTAFVRA